MKRTQATAVAIMVAGLAGCRSVPTRPVTKFPFQDDISFRGFAEEALYGYGTPRTHRFDDYTKGSYHVGPREVAEGLFKVAPAYGLQLDAVAVVGPYGPLWAYDVISVIREDGCTRVNWLLMPHARVTAKRSGCLPPELAEAFLREMNEVAPSAQPAPGNESCVVVSRAGQLRWSRFDCYVTEPPPEFGLMDGALERLSKRLVLTYSGYPPVEE